MKRIIAILFMLLLTAQFVQVVRDVSHSTFSIVQDEEQKEKVDKEENKEAKELIALSFVPGNGHNRIARASSLFMAGRLSHPYLARPTPPPDFSC